MAAQHCELCGAKGKTYWVKDAHWLCARCFKMARADRLKGAQ